MFFKEYPWELVSLGLRSMINSSSQIMEQYDGARGKLQLLNGYIVFQPLTVTEPEIPAPADVPEYVDVFLDMILKKHQHWVYGIIYIKTKLVLESCLIATCTLFANLKDLTIVASFKKGLLLVQTYVQLVPLDVEKRNVA